MFDSEKNRVGSTIVESVFHLEQYRITRYVVFPSSRRRGNQRAKKFDKHEMACIVVVKMIDKKKELGRSSRKIVQSFLRIVNLER